MTYLVEIYLPMNANGARPKIALVRDFLVERFGGATFHINSPAEGLWQGPEDTERDQIVVVEVLVDELDRSWWRKYRSRLEADFEQEQILIRGTETAIL